MDNLRPFQKRFIAEATAPGIDTAALSLPRGNGKSRLAAYLATRVLTPSDELFRAGTESVLCAASIEQARIVFRFIREDLEPTGEFRFADSHTRIGIVHKDTNTRLRVIGSNGKTALGLVRCPWAICDEPGAWEVNGGTLLTRCDRNREGQTEFAAEGALHWHPRARSRRLVARHDRGWLARLNFRPGITRR